MGHGRHSFPLRRTMGFSNRRRVPCGSLEMTMGSSFFVAAHASLPSLRFAQGREADECVRLYTSELEIEISRKSI
jgi:hypothetical protein